MAAAAAVTTTAAGTGTTTSTTAATGTGTASATVSSGDAFAVTLLLSNHDVFGFSERACYHFDLMDTLTQAPAITTRGVEIDSVPVVTTDTTTTDIAIDAIGSTSIPNSIHAPSSSSSSTTTTTTTSNSRNNCNVSGVVSLLECTSVDRRRKKKTALLGKIASFNQEARLKRTKHIQLLQQQLQHNENAYTTTSSSSPSSPSCSNHYCHQPTQYPLRFTPRTKLAFAYEITRMVFCIDASPTLTSTFGNVGNIQQNVEENDKCICAVDRLDKMTREFFEALVKPIVTTTTATTSTSATLSTSAKAKDLWNPIIAVTVIACYPKAMSSSSSFSTSSSATKEDESFSILVSDFRIENKIDANHLCNEISTWVAMEVETTIASKFSRTGGKPLESMTSSLQQIIETCSVCDDATLPKEGKPCFVIATDGRAVNCDYVMDVVQNEHLKDIPIHILDLSGSKTHRAKTGYIGGGGVSSSRSGSRGDMTHLEEKLEVLDEGEEEVFYLNYDDDGPSSFPLHITDDSEALFQVCRGTRGHFFDSHVLTSACKTILDENSKDLPFHEDDYFRFKRRSIRPNALQWYIIFSVSPCCEFSKGSGEIPIVKYLQQQQLPQLHNQNTIFTYKLDPIRIKSILIMRIMDGFRTRKYGQNTQNADKVSIQFIFHIEPGISILYEIQFQSSRYHNPQVGHATVKIYLMCSSELFRVVRSLYLSSPQHPITQSNVSKQNLFALKTQRFLKIIIDEDYREQHICPLDWSNVLSKNSKFVIAIEKLNTSDLYRHFQLESFEVFPMNKNDSNKSNGIISDLISGWTNEIFYEPFFIKKLPTIDGGLTNYCLVEVKMPTNPLRIFKINMHFFEQVDTQSRLSIIESLKKVVASSKDLIVFPKPIGYCTDPHLTVPSKTRSVYSSLNLYQHHEWRLLGDPELFSLLVKRRLEDKFYPIMETLSHTIMVKFIVDSLGILSLLQYSVHTVGNNVVVKLLTDHDKGDFSNAFQKMGIHIDSPLTSFEGISQRLKKVDQQYAESLQSRRNLLSLFNDNIEDCKGESARHADDVKILLPYAEEFIIPLRFFNECSAKANDILEDLTLKFIMSGSLGKDVVELSVKSSEKWLLLRLNEDVLIIFYLPTSYESDGDSIARKLYAYPITTSNLYADPGLAKSLDLNNLKSEIMNAHENHFSLASYLALSQSTAESHVKFTPSDFDRVMNYCEQKKIATKDIHIMSNSEADVSDDSKSNSKLIHFILKSLKHVELNESCSSNESTTYFYFDGKYCSEIKKLKEDISLQQIYRDLYSKGGKVESSEPLFISFKLNDKPASLQCLRSIQSGTLDVYITRHKERPTTHAKLHEAIAHHLQTRLNAFVAEQKLERLRNEHLIDDIEFKSVKECLMNAETVSSSSTLVQFYFSKTDSMIDASTSIRYDFQKNFELLCDCFLKQSILPMIEVTCGEYERNNEFFATNVKEVGWCYVAIQNYSKILFYVYHPSGIEKAKEIAKMAEDAIRAANKTANQLLILEHMYKYKSASSLMIPEARKEKNNRKVCLDYIDGCFKCDETFKSEYELNRHQPDAIRRVISKLQPFGLALEDCQDFLVDKDDDGRIFYMKLRARSSEGNEVYKVEFVVYGLQQPGSSITDILNTRLRREFMTICTENISSILQKNERFNLSDTDVKFINGFQKMWGDENKYPNEKIYSFPSLIYDPVMVMVYFRQNIHASYYFKSSIDTDNDEQHLRGPDEVDEGNGIKFCLNHREFNLFYIASKFEVGDNQISTLSEAGRKFCNEAKTGVALIEIKLLDANLDAYESLNVGMMGNEKKLDVTNMNVNEMKFHKLVKDEDCPSAYNVSVRVINTTLEVEPLHKWIELTLNQALAGWIMERHLKQNQVMLETFNPTNILGFAKVFHHAWGLPHPAIKKLELKGNIKSTDLNRLTYNILGCLFNTIFDTHKRQINEIRGLEIFRLYNEHSSRVVKFVPLSRQQVIHTVDNNSHELLHDNAAMDVKYISSFGFSIGNKRQWKEIPLTSNLFQKVRVDRKHADDGSLSSALAKLVEIDPETFTRRIAFLIIVTRKDTKILFYNWNPKVVESAIQQVSDTFSELNTLKEKIANSKKIKVPSTKLYIPKLIKQSERRKAPTDLSRFNKMKYTGKYMKTRTNNKSLKSNVGLVNQPSRAAHTSRSFKARQIDVDKSKKVERKDSNNMLQYLPSSVIKYQNGVNKAVDNTTSTNSATSALTKNVCSSFRSKLTGQVESFQAIEFIVSHTNLVYVQSFPIMQPICVDPYPFLCYLVKKIFASVLAKNFSWNDRENEKPNVKNPVLFFIKRCEPSKHCTMIIMHEVSIISHLKIGRVRCWVLVKGRACARKLNTLSRLEIKRHLFEFISTVLICIVKRSSPSFKHNLNIPMILQEIKSIYPSKLQRGTKIGQSFRIYYRTLILKESSDFTLKKVMDKVQEKRKAYNLSDCGEGFGGNVSGNIHDVHYFVTPCEENKRGLEYANIFIILFTNGPKSDLDTSDFSKSFTESVVQHQIHLVFRAIMILFKKVSSKWIEQSEWV